MRDWPSPLLHVSDRPTHLRRPSCFRTVIASGWLSGLRRVCSAAFRGVIKVRLSIDPSSRIRSRSFDLRPMAATPSTSSAFAVFTTWTACSARRPVKPKVLPADHKVHRFFHLKTAPGCIPGSVLCLHSAAVPGVRGGSSSMTLSDALPFRAFPSWIALRPSLVGVPSRRWRAVGMLYASQKALYSIPSVFVDLKGLRHSRVRCRPTARCLAMSGPMLS